MGFLAKGKEKENEFVKDYKLIHEGTTSKSSTKSEDINKHFDLTINCKKYDVKGLKKINRVDTMPNEQYHWIELKNVNGKLGWLYGEADYFAFELNEYWLIVDKLKLQELIASKVNKNIEVFEQDEALYCIYKRDNRKDCLTLVKSIDLMSITDEIIHKPADSAIKHDYGSSIYPEKSEKQRISNLLLKHLEN
jgi:hypothetical protein